MNADTKNAIETYLALAPDDVIAGLLGMTAVQLALRLDAADDSSPAEVVRGMLDGGAFDAGEPWPTLKRRLRIHTQNARRMYRAAAIVAEPRRPQG